VAERAALAVRQVLVGTIATTQADDGFVMALVNEALAKPELEREELVRRKCGGDTDLFQEVWRRVQLELTLGGFLLVPLIPRAEIEHPFEPGEVLNDRFRIGREIGRGGMGVVYEAIDQRLKKRIAIKCAKPGFQRRLPPEARNATEINHPNVCRMYEIHTATTLHGEVDFLTMEYLDGETLAQLLEHNGPLPADKACEILRQVCAGLEEAHRKDVIHGDLKSSNIVLTKGGGSAVVPVITDFGLARRAGGPATSALLASASGGTPAYMAPELWQGTKASVASDVYALGVVFYETLTGRLPRAVIEDGKVPLASSLKLLRIPRIGHRLQRVLSRCLDSDPERRPARAAEIAIAITRREQGLRLVRGAAAAAVLALAGPIILPQPSRDPVRLAMLPFDAPQEQQAVIDSAVFNSSDLLSRVRHPGWRFSVIPLGQSMKRHVKTAEKACQELRATHVLHGNLRQNGASITVSATVTAACSQQALKALVLEYDASEAGSLPVGLAGVVTRTLHLPPIASRGTLKAPSNRNYVAGLKYLQHESQVDKAIALLERAAAVDRHVPSIWAALAEAYRLKYNITNDPRYRLLAKKTSCKAESLDPDSAAVCRITGILRFDSGQYARAEEDFKRSIELEPSNPGGYRRLATAYERLDRPQDALETLLRAVEVAPYDFESYQRLGGFYLGFGQYEKAAEQLRTAVELNPREPAVHVNLASAYIELGQYANAERELRIALGINETPNALVDLAVALEYQGRNEEASIYERKAAALSPDNYLPWLNLGESCRRTGRKAESDAAYHKALDLTLAGLKRNPQDAYIRAIRAYVLARLGERVQAETEIKQALSFPAMDSEVVRTAALTYEALGLREDTLAILKDAPRALIADLSRHANMADLRRDPRFIELLASYNLRK
jgi:serine/threonine protein kinase/Flp pilus assembly protein TadD